MASVYKRQRDKGRRGAVWYFAYQNHRGQRRSKKGFTDKKKTEEHAAAVELLEAKKRDGLVDPIVDRYRVHSTSPITDQLADYKKSLKKRTPKYQQQTTNRVKRVLAAGAITTIGEFTIDGVLSAIDSVCEKSGSGHKTFNHYVDAVYGVCHWLDKIANRVLSNPLEGIQSKKLNEEEDVRHQRRALLPHEFAALVQSAKASGVSIQCYDGETRARIYVLSNLTGLRRAELASLTTKRFSLAGEQPTVKVEAATTTS